MENGSKIVMIFFIGYEICKLFNIRRVFRSVKVAILSMHPKKNSGSPDAASASMTMFKEMGWMIHLELLYPFAMVFLLFTKFYWVGICVLLISIASFIVFFWGCVKREDANGKIVFRDGLLMIGLVVVSILSLAVMLYAVFFERWLGVERFSHFI